MLTRGRILIGVGVLGVLAVAFTGWQAYAVQQDLTTAENSAGRIRAALESDDVPARNTAIDDLSSASSSAADTTGGFWWGAMSIVPIIGDDFEGIEVLSASLDTISNDGIRPVAGSIATLDEITQDGRVGIEALRGIQAPLAQAATAFSTANQDMSSLDSSGYVGAVGSRFDEAAARLDDAASSLASAVKAAEVLPSMLGGDGPRDYLLIFQNNAEIRATGGLPGSWAQIHAEDGELEIILQGGATDFPVTNQTALPLTNEEVEVYGKAYGQYFQNPGFSPDFPRAGALWRAHWDKKFPDVPLDGVIALDPVGLSYLIDGTGPIKLRDTTLTSDNLVEELLNKPYLELEQDEQDELFEEATRSVFDAATGDLASPAAFVEGMSRAAREGRFLVAPFVDDELEALADTRVLGQLAGDEGPTPHVDIGINDATASKMSYYLRYSTEVETRSCVEGVQTFAGTLTLRQSISPADAAELPFSVTGGGQYGTVAGSQLTFVRIYGPFEGTIEDLQLNGKVVDEAEVLPLDGRPVVTLGLLLENRDDLVVTWAMTGAKGQTGDVEVVTTPSVVPVTNSQQAASACSKD